jgi:hypothetical protein
MHDHELWWAMLFHRTLELSRVLPKQLRGTVQFEVATRDGERVHFHLLLRGARTSGGAGVLPSADALVKTSDEKLHALMFADQPPSDALIVSGNAHLFRSLLECLERSAAPKSLLQTRCQP